MSAWGYLICAYLVTLFIRFHLDLAQNTTRMKERHVSLFPQIHTLLSSPNGHQGHVGPVVAAPE